MYKPPLFIGAALVLILVFVQFGLRWFYGFKVSDKGIDFVLFGGVRVLRIPFETIEEIRPVSWQEAMKMFTVLRAGNRFAGGIVLVKRSTGLRRNVLITPDRPDEFIREVKERMEQLR